jgi:RND family efflux transporter MFP subunit
MLEYHNIMKNRRFVRYLKNKYVITGLVVFLAILGYFFTRSSSSSKIESAVVNTGDVVEKVSVTGTVSPVGKADLAFVKSGVIANISVKIGDKVKKGDIIASLDTASDSASLASAQANLAELERGLRPEEFALDQATMNSASTTLANAQLGVVNGLRDSYTKAQSAVINYTDIFFNNPQSYNPTINISVKSQNNETAINSGRLSVTIALEKWKVDIDTTTVSNSADMILKAQGYLDTIKVFLSRLSNIISDLNFANGPSQTTITSYVSTMNTALSNLNLAISSITTADTNLKVATSGFTQAENQFTLKKSGTSKETIDSQIAKVYGAQAELQKDKIYSPIDGLITKADLNVGEFAQAGKSLFGVQSDESYKIEARVPEADIAKISLNSSASVTLDAYGSYVIFPAFVFTIDPAETVIEGVPTYKVTLLFTKQDSRIRSGMTANTDVLTHEVKNVLKIPSRAVIDNGGVKTVRVLNKDGKTFTSVPVTIGLKGSDGTTEVTSGLSSGQKVVTYVK